MHVALFGVVVMSPTLRHPTPDVKGSGSTIWIAPLQSSRPRRIMGADRGMAPGTTTEGATHNGTDRHRA